MENEEKEILRVNRVELVENLIMDGGLFTQLIAKKVLNQRAVNNIKLKRTPEEQAEELLNVLPKRDCFSKFCEALIADEQDDIVKKYLKLLPKSSGQTNAATSLTTPAPGSTVAKSSATKETGAAPSETIDSVSPSIDVNVHPASSVICIKESDNSHVYIEYKNNNVSPQKRMRLCEPENSCELDNTRYVNKHYIAQEAENIAALDQSLAISHAQRTGSVLPIDNPQSVFHNRNISDPDRYIAAYAHQQSSQGVVPAVLLSQNQHFAQQDLSSPLKDPLSRVNEQQAPSSHILRLEEGHNQNNSANVSAATFVRHPLSTAMNPSRIPDRYAHPHQYLVSSGHLPSTKINNPPVMTANLPGKERISMSRADSVDTMHLRIQGNEVSPTIIEQDSFTSHNPVEVNSVTLTAAAGAAISLSEPLSTTALSGTSSSSLVVAHDPLPPPGRCCEMDEIDLPDGCVNVKVEHSSRQFFMNHYKKAYPMRQIPRGLFLLINVNEVEGKPPRTGTNFDRDNLCNLLCQLHFEPIVYNDSDGLSAQEIVDKLKEFAKRKEHADSDACFICLLSHGEEGYIFGTDGKRIPLEEIILLFGNTNCKGLIGKPKIFIIQACRGGALDKGVRMDEPDGGPSPSASSSLQLPTMSDMLICYPTLHGYYAWRNRARGSWYIEAIVQVFMRFARNEDICVMLNRVNQLVSKKLSECNQKEMNQMSQMSEFKSSLRQPHLFFFPGIGCSQN